MIEKALEGFLKAIILVALLAIIALLEGILVKWMWNWLMPVLLNLPTISFIQGWGLSFLGGLLFGRINVNNNG